jgi:hypothetical protein
MTDREILERAAAILDSNGYEGAASWLNHALREWEPDAPQPEGKLVRIAVAANERGGVYLCEIDAFINQDEAFEDIFGRASGDIITYRGIVTAILPPTAIPVVKGKVSP